MSVAEKNYEYYYEVRLKSGETTHHGFDLLRPHTETELYKMIQQSYNGQMVSARRIAKSDYPSDD